MDRESLIKSFEESKQLFTLPQVLNEMLEVLESTEAPVNEIARVIMKDPTLTVRVLKIANSPFYRRHDRISTVNQAILVMGRTAIKSLALSASLLNLTKFQDGAERFARDPKMFWKHSLETGIGARLLADACGHSEPEEAMVAGLLHDIGVLFLETKFPDEYEKVIESIKSGDDIISAERMIFDIDHCELGGILGTKWNLPPQFVETIEKHHAVENHSNKVDAGRLVYLTALANNLTRYDIEIYSENLERKINNVQILNRRLELPRDEIDQVRIRMMGEMIESASNFDIDIGNPTELLNQANAELCEIYLTVENLFRERQELTRQLLEDERKSGAIESLNIAVSTLAHYINNATMAISGRSQLLRMLLDNGQLKDSGDKLLKALEVIDASVLKIGATLAELREFTSLEKATFFDHSQALNIEEQLKKRIESMIADQKSQLTAGH
jgi:two-component system cell cycle response regulator